MASDQKAKRNQFVSDGDTVPLAALDGQMVGDIRNYNVTTQTIGLVQSINWDNQRDNAAAVGDHTEMRITGIIDVVKGVGALSAGDRVAWDGSQMLLNATGAHMVIGDYASADTRVHININLFPGVRTP